MYIPAAFAVTDLDLLHAAIDAHGLALMVTMTPDGLIASHLPLLLDRTRGPRGTLIGHLARANPQATSSDPAIPALVMFPGVDGYISPSMYATKHQTGKAVPTWNYTAIHAYGTAEFFSDTERLRDVVTRLTDKQEAVRPVPWAVSDAPADFIDGMLRAIVGVEIPIDRLEGKAKLSQNRPAVDHAGIISGLEAEGRTDLAAQVARALADKA
jgi:transcriptional regulator